MKKRSTNHIQKTIFTQAEDMPLFSLTPITVRLETFRPAEAVRRQCLPGFELEACSKKFEIRRQSSCVEFDVYEHDPDW
jgi:hypothetical protein